MTTAPNLTLYGIETQLLELLIFRDSVLEDPDITPQEQKASLDAIDSSIQTYVMAEVKKCDGVAHYLREFEKRAAAEDEEIERLKRRKQMWEKRHETLEKMVISIMQQTGKTRIDGVHSVLQLKKNPPSVEVQSPNLVPDEYNRVTITMPDSLWREIKIALIDAKRAPIYGAIDDKAKVSPAEPMKQKISEELKVGGSVPGCRLKTDSVRLEVK